MSDLNATSLHLLHQLKEVVSSLDEADFNKPLDALNDATIGQHVRHTLEFFSSLQDSKSTGIVNYDERKRDKDLEQVKESVFSRIEQLMIFLSSQKMDFGLAFQADYSDDGMDPVVLESSFCRELVSTIEHTIHHMAIIKIAIKVAFPYVVVPENFGVAQSTLRYQALLTK